MSGDLRPLYPRKQTLVALQSFGLKKRTSDVGFTPESEHKWLGRGMSAFDPKRTFNGLFCLAGVDRKPGVVVPLDHPPLPTTIWAVWSRRTRARRGRETTPEVNPSLTYVT